VAPSALGRSLFRLVLPPLGWGGQRTGVSLAAASAGWLLSGLSASPLINGLLPALGAITTLLPLRGRPFLGVLLQLAGILGLLAVALKRTGSWVGWPLMAALLVGVGTTCALPPLRQWLLGEGGLPLRRLQVLGDGGAVLGSLLTAGLFPLQRSLAPQFTVAALLLLPTIAMVRQAAKPASSGASTQGRINPRACLQGLLFGSLFALLPLWVRTIGQGTCIDFGLVLTAYGLGRPLGPWLQSLRGTVAAAAPQRLATAVAPMAGAGGYLAMALLLLGTLALPGWAAGGLFLPLGALAASSDALLLEGFLGESGDGSAGGLRSLERSGALGTLLGSLGMGLAAEALGLAPARILIVVGFLVAAVVLPGRNLRR
jgi:hypothetical protein